MGISLHSLAYIGPGGGLAISVSLITVLMAVLGAVFIFITWPITAVIGWLRGKRLRFRYPVKKVVVLGLDGLDYRLLQRFMAEGKLPNCKKLAERGTCQSLATTWPAITPSAWPSGAVV